MSEQFKSLGCTNAFLLDGGGSSTMVIRDGDKLTTVCHAEDGNDGEGRSIANIAIMAVRKDGKVALETEKETEKATAKQTTKKPSTNKNTDKATEASTNLDTGFNESESGAAQNDGCGGALVFPAILATGGIAVVGFSKKRGERKNKKK